MFRLRRSAILAPLLLLAIIVAVRPASAQMDFFTEVDRLLAVLSRPFDEQPEAEHYAALPPDWASGLEVSCSS